MNFYKAIVELRSILEDNKELCWALRFGLFDHAAILSRYDSLRFTNRDKYYVYVSWFGDPYFITTVYVGPIK